MEGLYGGAIHRLGAEQEKYQALLKTCVHAVADTVDE
jgi:hypothetical protein